MHQRFNFKDQEELLRKAEELSVIIPFSDDTTILKLPVRVGHLTAPNRFAVLPMEGCDSNPDGNPTDLVQRRYTRFSEGGSGLLWWEACAVVEEGKANPLQMMLTKDNLGSFETLLAATRRAGQNKNGENHRAVNILQLTHSGRYARWQGEKGTPLIAQRDPILDPRVGITDDSLIVTDDYLDSLVERYVASAKLAQQAGFDGVDIKACHRYLLSELLASHNREGKYGGSFENRTRLLLDIVREVKKVVGNDFIVASRFNVFDAHPYPYGFGCSQEDMWSFDPREPMLLVEKLVENGAGLLSNTAGNPYYIYPQVTRPFDRSSTGIPIPEEHPLESIQRLFHFTEKVQEAAGSVPVVGNGYSWLRQFAPFVGAANIAKGRCTFVGLGRSSFAYPEGPRDFLQKGKMDPKKCCTSCSMCTQIMRDHGSTGCVTKDREIYLPVYQAGRKQAE